MTLIILLLTTVSAEWIEITQQYQKPINQHSSESDQVYFNDSIDWYKDTNVHRDKTLKSNIYHKVNFDINSTNDKVSGILKQEILGKVERVPATKLGNIERVTIPGAAVKSPVLKIGSSRPSTVSPRFKGNNIRNNPDILASNRKKNTVTERIKTTTTVNSKEDSKVEVNGLKNPPTRNEFTNYKPIKLRDEKPQFITERDSFESSSTETGHTLNKNFMNNRNVVKMEQHNPKLHKPIINDSDPPKFVTKGESVPPQINNAQNNDSKVKQKTSNKVMKNEKEPHKTVIEDPKKNTLETIVKFMKVVADNISKNTRKSFNSKLQYLQQLKNSILANIENRIDATWPDDSERSRRSADTARGHVQFPSSESALMTISFLTFAVFLIKLVLQVIQTYKSKAMMVGPVVLTAAGRAGRNDERSKQKYN